jgi:hypothetical protein
MSDPAAPASPRTRPPRLARLGQALLILLGLFYLYGAAADLAALARRNLPADHRGTFTRLTGTSYAHAQAATPGIASYISALERGYALHELTFALLFLLIIAIPFRARQRWAWWAAWLPMIANLGYTVTFGTHDHIILVRSLIADIALPVLLLAHIPAFFATSPGNPATAPPTSA